MLNNLIKTNAALGLSIWQMIDQFTCFESVLVKKMHSHSHNSIEFLSAEEVCYIFIVFIYCSMNMCQKCVSQLTKPSTFLFSSWVNTSMVNKGIKLITAFYESWAP